MPTHTLGRGIKVPEPPEHVEHCNVVNPVVWLRAVTSCCNADYSVNDNLAPHKFLSNSKGQSAKANPALSLFGFQCWRWMYLLKLELKMTVFRETEMSRTWMIYLITPAGVQFVSSGFWNPIFQVKNISIILLQEYLNMFPREVMMLAVVLRRAGDWWVPEFEP